MNCESCKSPTEWISVTILASGKFNTFLKSTTYFQISDYPDIYHQCSVEDQKLLAIFTVDTGPYSRHKFGYRKRTAPVKLKVQLSLIEERLQLIVRISIYSCYCFKMLSKLLSKFFCTSFHEINLLTLRTPNCWSLHSRKMNPGSKDYKIYLTIWLHRKVHIGNLFTNMFCFNWYSLKYYKYVLDMTIKLLL